MMSYSGLDFVYYVLGVNIIPADTINKKPIGDWTYYQNNELTEQEYLENKKNGLYNKGIAIVCGKIWRGRFKGYWLNGIDLDNELAKREFCTDKNGVIRIDYILSDHLVESHEDDPNSIHVLVVTSEPMVSKWPDKFFDKTMQPAIEIKSGGTGLLYSYPSMHGSDDKKVIKQWMFNELKEPAFVEKEQIEKHIDNICKKHGLPYLESRGKKDNIKEKIRELRKIPEGSRHIDLLTECNNLWWENLVGFNEEKITEDEVYQKFLKIAERCDPPHDEADIRRIFDDSLTFVSNEMRLNPAQYFKAEKEFHKEENKDAKKKEKAKQDKQEQEEYERVDKLSKTIGSFEEWQKGMQIRYETIRRTVLKLMSDVWPSLEFELAVRNILYIQESDKPFGGILLGRPSSSKTLGIGLFKGQRNVYRTDDFTPKSFLSHSTAVSKEELEEIDMLPKIENKFFLTPELAPIFNTNEDELRKTMGILTRVLDGEGYASDSGAHGHRAHDREMIFAWIGATATISPKVYEVMSQLGPRLYFLRLPSTTRKLENYVTMSKQNTHRQDKIEIRKLLVEYQDWLEACPIAVKDKFYDSKLRKIPWNIEKDNEKTLLIIARLAELLAPLRGTIQSWSINKTEKRTYFNHGLKNVEDPLRAFFQLSALARGYALVKGRNYITDKEIPLLIKVVLSTAPEERASVFDLLLAYDGQLTAQKIQESLNVDKNVAYKTMNELDGLGLCVNVRDEDPDGLTRARYILTLKQEFNWFLEDEFKELRNGKSEEFR